MEDDAFDDNSSSFANHDQNYSYYDYYYDDGLITNYSLVNCEATVDSKANLAIIPTFYWLVFLFGVLGNGLVVWSTLHLKQKKRNTDLYIVSLAVADLVFVVTLPLWSIYTAIGYHWPFGGLLCTACRFIISLNMYASVLCLVILSLDRYVAVVHSFKAQRFRNKTMARRCIAGIWTVSVILSFPTIVLTTTKTTPDDNEMVHCTVSYDSVSSVLEDHAKLDGSLGLFVTFTSFLLPLGAMAFCYICIFKKIHEHFTVRNEVEKRRKLLRTIIVLLLAFFVCWFPFHLVKIVRSLAMLNAIEYTCGLSTFINQSLNYFVCLGYLNSCLNPILYACVDDKFRKLLAALTRCESLKTLVQTQETSAVSQSRDDPSPDRPTKTLVEHI
uniref:apelin receptor B-like n=1 Tax=Myxine glutinosa TaxID=7769 RepID=UPI00359016D5